MKRKTLENSLEIAELSDKERAFVADGIPKPKLALVVEQPQPVQEHAAPSPAITPPQVEEPMASVIAGPGMGVEEKAPKRKREPKSVAPKAAEHEVPQGLVSRSFRLSYDVADGLLDATVKRRKLRERPFSQEGLVDDILRAWLIENGFIKEE